MYQRALDQVQPCAFVYMYVFRIAYVCGKNTHAILLKDYHVTIADYIASYVVPVVIC